MKIDAVDLFCGAGGLSFGLKKAGITVRAGVDFDPACEYPYDANLGKGKFIRKDVSKVASGDVEAFFNEGRYSLLAGCAPCQPFSTLRNGTEREKSDKWPLLSHFGRLVRDIQPDFVTMENVPALRTQSIFDDFLSVLRRSGYFVTHQIVNAADYGVPQRRKRLVLIASKHGNVRLLSPEELGCETKTVRSAIAGLPKLKAGESDATDLLHKARSLTAVNLARIKASKPGGTWHDWPVALRAPCHQRANGQSFKSVYARMEWDKPAPTMTTQCFNFGTGRFGHPVQDRAITLREAAILQSFPDNYKFVKSGEEIKMSTLGRLIGNAVPVDLGYAIGMSISKHAKYIKRGNSGEA
ncbi:MULTISPECIES: DNA cytosine methyltransferase [unclassified Paraburkholderia]|uniref:DNA cytosine methyltransferase n=1 Tax=unclassified Paraburkholderia TaxID=2615204 RepID=UPI002AB2ABAF|nr:MULTISPECIES: DNA cytosine methyltransferase [unclassified Paraburkholderia]